MELLKIEDLKKELYTGDYGDCFCDYDDGCICDIIAKIADNHIDICNSDLLDWAKGNYSYIEESISEFGIDSKNFNFFELIQQGQYLYNERNLYDNLEDSLKFFVYTYIKNVLKIEEITEEQNDDLLDFDFNDNNESLENLIEHIENIFQKTEEEE